MEVGKGDDYRPEFLLDYGVILVTVNYRLGPLGFLSLDTPRVPGNQGIRDVQLALRWVQERISHFGGDPDRVVVFGESGGHTASLERCFDKI